ncbi:MAG TPA: sulfite exporter TauE/SafE family protein [Nocardioides sp.]|jgi:hypothetical protein|uniref:sulfite exporter TauE/SafE family protein n=1 Tax=Nocardioides sp. TaxID=35761 RepID=UPI002E325425|nr:sulfite exporter TauE/SafE family protein [Nocardioides sp.]HEX3932689.1 sulfite exporter TauE/SafE family protein [Nocardioides sp.]
MGGWLTSDFASILIAGFLVGIVVGLTGMGGGALMTPALIFLGVGGASTVVTADLTAAAISRSAGALTHARHGSPNLVLAKWLIIGSVPAALVGPWVVHGFAGGSKATVDRLLMECIGFALLFAATTYALRIYLNLRRSHGDPTPADPDPPIRPLVTLGVGALGGLLVGITSVGAGSVIMIALLILYPGLPPVRLVGTDLVQAVPLVLAAAASNIAINGLDWHILVPLVLGSTPGTILGSRIAPRVPQSYIRRGIVIVLTMSGVALLDKSGWAPLGSAKDQTHPVLVAGVGIAMVVLGPLVWGLVRRTEGLPMFGAPTVAQLEGGDPGPRRTPSDEPAADEPQSP